MSKILEAHPALIKGHVILDYVRKGKILERIEGDNMCFDSTFNATNNWFDYISGNDTYMYIYANGNYANAELPYPRQASCMGTGVKGKPASGTTQGAWNAKKSYDNKVLNSGNGVSFKWAYDWSVTQMLGNEIRSLGMGNAFSNITINRSQRSPSGGVSFVNNGYVGYKINITGVERLIARRNLKTQETLPEINIASKVKTDNVSGDQWSMGFAADNSKSYVMLYNTNAAQASTRRLLYEFSDSTFTTLLNTYTISALTTYPTALTKGFVVYKNKMYIPNHDILEYNFITNAVPVNFPAPTAIIPIYNFTNFLPQTALLFKGSYLIRSNHGQVVPVFNMETRAYEPEAMGTFYSNPYQMAPYIEPLIGDNPIIFTSGGPTSAGIGAYPYFISQMLSCFRLPDNSPVRPEDSGVSIDYQIDILYQ